MSKESVNLIQVAQVLKSNGTDGEVVVSFRDISPEELNLTEPVYIYFDGLPVPFFITSLTQRGTSKALVHLNDVDNFEDAQEMVGKGIFLPDDGQDLEDDYAAFVGWRLWCSGEEEDVEVGTVIDFLDIPNNPCLEVETKNGAVVTIPLHEDFIISLDPDAGEILMDLPDGLLDL